MYNTQSSGSPISKYCKAGRKITKPPYYAAGLGKSAPVLGSSWEIEADGTSQTCVAEPGSGCWGCESKAGCLPCPTCQQPVPDQGHEHEAEVLRICRKITNSGDFSAKTPSIYIFVF